MPLLNTYIKKKKTITYKLKTFTIRVDYKIYGYNFDLNYLKYFLLLKI